MAIILVANFKGGTGKTTLARAFADVLDADLIDIDPQKSLTHTASIADRKLPIEENEVSADHVIFDTPPYNFEKTRELLPSATFVVVPVYSGHADLVAFSALYKALKKMKALDRTWVVFNNVRKPITRNHKEIRKFFKKNYGDCNFARTELSSLIGFNRVLAHKLEGKALFQIKSLLREIFKK